jgi:uncharacterized protein (TIGR02300 family)
VAKPELGTKRLCPHCGAKFYDLGKNPIVCPKCGSEVEIAPLPSRGGRPEARAAAASSDEAEPAEAQGAEMVSLEEADAETSGKKAVGSPDVDVDEDVEDDAEDDSTFLEETDDENDDVSDIIGSDIEDEEES